MKAVIVTDETAGIAGMKLAERPEPPQSRLMPFLPTDQQSTLL